MPSASDLLNAIVEQEIQRRQSQTPSGSFAGVPSLNPAMGQQAFDMFGPIGGSVQDEMAKQLAERYYDYAQAEAEATARRANPRIPGFLDTESQIEQEIFKPIRDRWEPIAKTVVQKAAAAPSAKVVGKSLAVQNPETGAWEFSTPPDTTGMSKSDELEARQLMKDLAGIDSQTVKLAAESALPGGSATTPDEKRALNALRIGKEKRLNEILSKYKTNAVKKTDVTTAPNAISIKSIKLKSQP